MQQPSDSPSRWLLALESSTAHGGASLHDDGKPVETAALAEGLRHGRELMAAASSLLDRNGLRVRDLAGVAVSVGPGSYTGLRVGVMAAKALAYAGACRLAAVSSLAAKAETMAADGTVGAGELSLVVQDARRDEVYVGLYLASERGLEQVLPDKAATPEEAAGLLRKLIAEGRTVRAGGSAIASYPDLFAGTAATDGRVDPAAVGRLGWRQIVLEQTADPLLLQPVYLRRDEETDWRHDHLIAGT